MPNWKDFEHRTLKPLLRRLRPYRRVTFGGIRIAYRPNLDGGGSTFGQDYVPLLQKWGLPKQQRVFEWCAGPGFIGFSLLGHGLAETLCLADINPEAVAAARRTLADNGLTDRVAVYRSDNLADIPAQERWDLVVGNPPHFVDEFPGALRSHDPDWRIHRTFFRQVGAHLKPGGLLVLQENNRGSTAATFAAMIDDAGLKTVFVHDENPERTPDDRFFYLCVMRRGDTPPEWLAKLVERGATTGAGNA